MNRSARRLAALAAAHLCEFSAHAATSSIKTLQTWTGHIPAEVQPLFQASIANAADHRADLVAREAVQWLDDVERRGELVRVAQPLVDDLRV